MSRNEYAQYLRTQARYILDVAQEIEQGGPALTEWMVDWELRKERELLEGQEKYVGELDKSAEELGMVVA